MFGWTFPTQKDFSISRQKPLSMSAMCVCVLGAQYSSWRSNKIFSFVVWPKRLLFWRESKINRRQHWRCLLSWQVLFQRREMRISSGFCNSSEMLLWLWKVWILFVCSESFDYVTRVGEDDKNGPNTLCYLKNNCSKKSPFNQSDIEIKKCVWTTKYKRHLEMCHVQHVEIKVVFFFSTKRRALSTTVRSAEPAAMYWTLPLRTINRQSCCLAVVVHFTLQERRVATTKKSHFHSWENYSANHNQAQLNLSKKKQTSFFFWHICVDTPLVDTVNQKFI